ncbi:hypothetical protein NDU88_003288 [Pleurodeles waltl]|uniref:Uncharacterized protein n=1 Tax=Pleurodeles waltl TaxID=8319 RepID=A0AAV7TN03_PLEWA|nr:hypothetical protein NDU88_003288 [Pleurodeles waltl]
MLGGRNTSKKIGGLSTSKEIGVLYGTKERGVRSGTIEMGDPSGTLVTHKIEFAGEDNKEEICDKYVLDLNEGNSVGFEFFMEDATPSTSRRGDVFTPDN